MEGLRILRLPDVKPPCLTCPRSKGRGFFLSRDWLPGDWLPGTGCRGRRRPLFHDPDRSRASERPPGRLQPAMPFLSTNRHRSLRCNGLRVTALRVMRRWVAKARESSASEGRRSQPPMPFTQAGRAQDSPRLPRIRCIGINDKSRSTNEHRLTSTCADRCQSAMVRTG